ncbi:MAG: phosphotransacetylase family protein [Limnospira sp. PMC 737.11]|uniref:phosphotransacetylase family protein n=1 Tax=unclassified Limnospira TaxID=2642885 RepID=UPI0028E132BD|nr:MULTISPECIES: phosphotransacetylase family protein [unclassified Limnospira]MDT9235049.1 phosphotransacetylase family protein [Limnospira sp. PMC 917.15]MDT9274340.1 phosphotransacetylase family protein [Limnospira sp. PMC 737.11]
MAKLVKYVLIGSIERSSGKSAVTLGLVPQLRNLGFDIAYGKPLGTDFDDDCDHQVDADCDFIAQTLGLSEVYMRSPILMLDQVTIDKHLYHQDLNYYHQALTNYRHEMAGDLVLLEGPGTLQEGSLFNLSVPRMAEVLDAAVMLVVRCHSHSLLDEVLSAKERLGDRLIAIVLNDVTDQQVAKVETQIKPFLENAGIPVLGILPRNALLRSVTVRELVAQLEAQVVCGHERLDLIVETLSVGAMNVSSAMKYFSQSHNMAVVTGGDRTDIQMAALEQSTHCMILTGQLPPAQIVITRAEELEIPILCVDLDTLTTVESIDRAFGRVRIHDRVKVDCMTQIMAEKFDTTRLLQLLQ